MNVDNQVILHIKAGQLPPDDLLELMLKKVKPNVFGFSVQNTHEGKPDLAITREEVSKLDVSDLKQLFENAKDNAVNVYLGNRAKPVSAEDIQPFVIHDGDNNPFFAIYLEGTLLGHDDPKEHSEQFNYVNGLLIPKIVEWCNDFEGDLDKIVAKLKGDTFKKEFLVNVGHRAVLSIMPCDGDVINLGKNEIGTEPADWGWASIKHGYGDPAPVARPEPKAEAAPRKSFWGGSKKPEEVKTSVPSVSTDANGIHTVTGRDGKPVNDAGSPLKSETPKLAARPPSWVNKNEDVKLWYDIVTNKVPSEWKKRLPGIVVDFEAAQIDNLEAFKTYALKKKLAAAESKTDTATPAPSAATARDISGAVGNKELPIIEPKDLEKVLEYVAKYIDGNSNVIPDPKQMQAIEKELPNFAACIGLKPEETLNWPLGSLIGIGQTDIRALALYATMWRSIARPHVIAATKTNVVTTAVDLGNGSKKVESVDKTPAPAPKKSFWGGKAA